MTAPSAFPPHSGAAAVEVVGFSGHDVRHADGRQLQRVGIQPHVKAEPTPKGISAGRDEVLEAALRYLDEAAQIK